MYKKAIILLALVACASALPRHRRSYPVAGPVALPAYGRLPYQDNNNKHTRYKQEKSYK